MKELERKYNRKSVLSTALVAFFVVSSFLPFQGFISTAAVTRISIHPNPASPGQAIKVVGYNFPVATTVSLKLDATAIGTVIVGSNGEFTFPYTLPSTTTLTSHTIYATDTSIAVSVTFTIVAAIKLTPVRAIDGGKVVVSGVGLAPSVKATISFDGKTIGTQKTTSTGTLSYSYVIPTTTIAGNHVFMVTDSSGDKDSATFTTISKITTAPTKGIAGVTSVTVKVNGFGATLPLTITFDGKSIPNLLPQSTNSTGGTKFIFTVPLYTPALPAGTYVLQVVDSASNSDSAMFTIS
jgi:hypothetical protein